MKVAVRLQIVGDDGIVVADDEILELAKGTDRLEALGLSLAEAKQMLRATQERLLTAQATDQATDFVTRYRRCPDCGRVRPSKGLTRIQFRTLFGTVDVPSRRLHHCACHPQAGRTFSPRPSCSPSMPRRSSCSWRRNGRPWSPTASPPTC